MQDLQSKNLQAGNLSERPGSREITRFAWLMEAPEWKGPGPCHTGAPLDRCDWSFARAPTLIPGLSRFPERALGQSHSRTARGWHRRRDEEFRPALRASDASPGGRFARRWTSPGRSPTRWPTRPPRPIPNPCTVPQRDRWSCCNAAGAVPTGRTGHFRLGPAGRSAPGEAAIVGSHLGRQSRAWTVGCVLRGADHRVRPSLE